MRANASRPPSPERSPLPPSTEVLSRPVGPEASGRPAPGCADRERRQPPFCHPPDRQSLENEVHTRMPSPASALSRGLKCQIAAILETRVPVPAAVVLIAGALIRDVDI